MRALTVSLFIVLVCACRPPAVDGSTSASGGASTSDASSSSSGTTDACNGSSECDSDGLCVAEYIPADTLGGERGPAHCVDPNQCIGELDLGRWCFDHPSCCEGLRCRKIDGICETPDLGGSTGESGDTGDTSSTSSSGTDTDTDTSTGTDGTTGDTDTDTGTDTGTTG
ncbi:MAG: hypothetical protein H6711_16450 [Myxococcales bacterium]|nr:hypothetical protein [Myxococcales bacterium]